MHWLDASILLAFVAYAVWSGLSARRRSSADLGEYFLAGRSLGGTRAGLSMAATQFSADTPLLVMGLIGTAGIFALWRLWIYALAFVLLGCLLARCWRRAGVLTDAELCELRYSGKSAAVLRGVKAVYFGVVFNVTVLAMVLLAAARVAEPFLTWHLWLPPLLFEPVLDLVRASGVTLTTRRDAGALVASADNALSLLAVLVLTAFYSTAGGLRSVVRTDMVQLGLALGGTFLYGFYLIKEVGGLGALHAQLPAALERSGSELTVSQLLAFTPNAAADVGFAVLAVLGLQWLVQMNADGTGYLAQRCMACRTDRDARRATLVFSWTQIGLRSLLWLPIGLALLVLIPDATAVAQREQAYVVGMELYLPVGVRGLLLTAMLAALASTLDTHLNWGASYFTNDLYKRFYCEQWRRVPAEDRKLVRVARYSNLLIVVLSLAVMTQLSSIQQAWQASLLLGAGMGPILILRWLWWRVSASSELAAMLAATILAPVLLEWGPQGEALRLLCMAAGATGCGVVIAWIRPSKVTPELREFHRRVEPPGAWGPLDPESRSPRRLWIGVRQTITHCLALFCTLVALGTWLVGGTPPNPSVPRWLWIVSLLALAAMCLLVPKRDPSSNR